RLSKEEIDRMLKEAEQFREEDNKIRWRMETRHKLETYVYAARDALSECGTKLTPEEKAQAVHRIQELIEWLEKNPNAEKNELDEKFIDLEKICKPLMIKLHSQCGIDTTISDKTR
ncbi:major heat shock 70 kDa protein Ab-like, partial [Tropilaelaps mercedesae]